MKKIIFLLFILSLNLQAQSTFELFKNNLPKEVLVNEQLKNMAITNLDKAMSIHPDIIYSYLCFLEVQVAAANKEEVKALMAHYNDLVKYYNKKKYDWAKRNYDNLKSSSEDEQMKLGLLKYYNDIMRSIKQDFKDSYSNVTIDSNKIHYNSVLYYTRNKNLKYDPGFNYYGERVDAEAGIVDKIKKAKSTDLKEVLETIDTHWYLYEKLPYDDQKNILFRLVKTESAMDPAMNRLGIGAGFLYSGNIKYKKEISTPIGKSINLSTDIVNKSIDISAIYIWRLKEVKTFLSYIGVEAGVSIGIGSVQESSLAYNDVTISKPTDLISIMEFVNVFNGKITFSESKSFYVQTNIPLIYVSNKLWLEAGLVVSGNMYKYVSSGTYNYSNEKKTKFNNGDFWTYNIERKAGTGSLVEDDNVLTFKVFPVFNINYEFSSNIMMSIRAFPDYYNAQLQYFF